MSVSAVGTATSTVSSCVPALTTLRFVPQEIALCKTNETILARNLAQQLELTENSQTVDIERSLVANRAGKHVTHSMDVQNVDVRWYKQRVLHG